MCFNCWAISLKNRPGEIQLSENLCSQDPASNEYIRSQVLKNYKNGLILLEITSAFPHQTLLDFFQGFYLNSLLPLPEKDMSDCKLSLFCETEREGKRNIGGFKILFYS